MTFSQVISDEDYSKCADQGRLDFGLLQRVAQQMPPRTLTSNLRISEIEPFESGENLHVLEDVAKMFDTSIVDELFLAATNEEFEDTLLGVKAKAMLPQLVALLSDVNVQNREGNTPLIWAAMRGHMEIAKELIGANADVNVKDEDGYTALIWAAMRGDTELAKELIGANADVNVTSNVGITPLTWAAEAGHSEIAKELIDAKANLNMQSHDKKTALILAAKFGHTEIAKELIGANADVSMKDHKGRTALKWANKRGHKEIANLISPRARRWW